MILFGAISSKFKHLANHALVGRRRGLSRLGCFAAYLGILYLISRRLGREAHLSVVEGAFAPSVLALYGICPHWRRGFISNP